METEETYQKIIGFGGAFTDAAGLNILSLPPELQDTVLRCCLSFMLPSFTYALTYFSVFSLTHYCFPDLCHINLLMLYSFMHSLTHLIIYLTHSFTHSCLASLTNSLIHSLTESWILYLLFTIASVKSMLKNTTIFLLHYLFIHCYYYFIYFHP